MPPSKADILYAGEYFDVKLKTCKSTQTGVLHTWWLFANDQDPKVCPKRMLIHLYPKDMNLQGPLFLKVSKHGVIIPVQMVSNVCDQVLQYQC